jgi:hypothetical protein
MVLALAQLAPHRESEGGLIHHLNRTIGPRDGLLCDGVKRDADAQTVAVDFVVRPHRFLP